VKDLIEIHADEEHMIHCDCCDGESVLTNIWYIPSESYGLPRYLACCKNKVGNVVDWDIERTTRLK
jgi:hypothetical protein